MTDLIAVQKIAGWEKLKTLVLDSVSSPITFFRLAGLNRLNVMTEALGDATRRVSRYLMLQFMVNAGFGILCGVGLYLIGVPYAALS